MVSTTTDRGVDSYLGTPTNAKRYQDQSWCIPMQSYSTEHTNVLCLASGLRVAGQNRLATPTAGLTSYER
jgi:hypothetical protein